MEATAPALKPGTRVRVKALTIRHSTCGLERKDWTELVRDREGSIMARSTGRKHSCGECWETEPRPAPVRGRDGRYMVKLDNGKEPGRIVFVEWDEMEVLP